MNYNDYKAGDIVEYRDKKYVIIISDDGSTNFAWVVGMVKIPETYEAGWLTRIKYLWGKDIFQLRKIEI